MNTLKLWRARRAYRNDLANRYALGSYLIRDIGLTVEQALIEAQKPFWKP
ncbi:hypothetical protein BH10PSE7_BH10PSE7_26920 [soil metagenome]